MCVDFRDLNKERPTDDLPLPYIDVLVDNIAAGHALFYFMDRCTGYNQVKVVVEEKEKTAFITPQQTYYYAVM